MLNQQGQTRLNLGEVYGNHHYLEVVAVNFFCENLCHKMDKSSM